MTKEILVLTLRSLGNGVGNEGGEDVGWGLLDGRRKDNIGIYWSRVWRKRGRKNWSSSLETRSRLCLRFFFKVRVLEVGWGWLGFKDLSAGSHIQASARLLSFFTKKGRLH